MLLAPCLPCLPSVFHPLIDSNGNWLTGDGNWVRTYMVIIRYTPKFLSHLLTIFLPPRDLNNH